MKCQRCHGCMARDHFLDMQESGGEWWIEGWRCINCGHVFDPLLERNRRMHAVAMAAVTVPASQVRKPVPVEDEEFSSDLAA